MPVNKLDHIAQIKSLKTSRRNTTSGFNFIFFGFRMIISLKDYDSEEGNHLHDKLIEITKDE